MWFTASTPFSSPSLRRVVRLFLQAEVDGLTALGVTGEGV
jgi:dihydrodipicolinate synthase/N-acetylneuraminate lyase